MEPSERSLSALGQHVGALQDQAPESRHDHALGRARLLAVELDAQAPKGARSKVRPSARRSPLRIAMPLAAAAVLLVAALTAVIVARPREALRFEVGPAAPGLVGEWIAAPPAAELPIRFSDGSLLRLAPGGRARVTSLDANGAEVALERGDLDLAVVHRPQTRWTLLAGPFLVHVIGTRFETRWDPMTEQLSVALREGAITLSGPVVGEARALHAGERITVSPATNTLVVGAIDAAVREAPAPGASPRDAPSPRARGAPDAPDAPDAPSSSASPSTTPPSTAPPSSAAPSSAPASSGHASEAQPASRSARAGAGRLSALPTARRETPGWRALALDARYKDALADAEAEGFDAICASASASDLRALGDAARFVGSSARAAQAFGALRDRFAGSTEAAEAAFILGKIAQDQRQDYADAARWFSRYLAEQPTSALAADAAGRLVEAEDRRGNDAGARRAAERYLGAYPSGPHAGYARRVLAQGAGQLAPSGATTASPGSSPARPAPGSAPAPSSP